MKSREETRKTYPIIFEKLEFKIVARYFGTLTKKISTGNNVIKNVRVGGSAFTTNCSSLNYLYTICGVDKNSIIPELFRGLSQYKKVLKESDHQRGNTLELKLWKEKSIILSML